MALWRGALFYGSIVTAFAVVAALSSIGARAQSSAPAPASAAPAAEVSPPRPPADPTAAAVYAVLDKHCARCHQAGRLERPAPAAAFGHILRLDEVAATPWLVQPGNPDASRLYQMMLRRLMPPMAAAADGSPLLPTSDEIAVVRSWISELPPSGTQCADRRAVSEADHAASLALLRTATGENPKRLRFVSIAHLYNGCARPEALAAYRQAIVRLFNSLSWKSAPVATPSIDPAGTLFKINLDDLGWLPEHWERIMRSGGSPLGLTAPLPADIRTAYGTDTPVARADWFAKSVLSAPLYYEVLGLPGTGPEILKVLQIPGAPPVDTTRDVRALARRPAFSIQPSLVERLQSRFGPLWQSFHWLAGEDAPDLDGDTVPKSADVSPPFQAVRGMFTLPNGLPGFFVIGQRGDRLDVVPPGTAKPAVAGSAPIVGGLGCMACHAGGPIKPDDAATAAARGVDGAIAFDRKSMADAMSRVGVDPTLLIDGVTPVLALAEAYARPLDGTRAAAELGVDLKALADLADGGGEPASILARRLMQGLVARSEIEEHAPELTKALGRPRLATDNTAHPATPPLGFVPVDAGPGVILFSDKFRYRKGDSLNLTVRVSTDCHVTIVSIDTRGRGTVLFPSDFETNSLLSAGRELRLPGPDAPFALRLNEPGRETIVALCNEAGSTTDNIRYDFERQRFAELGDYATFIAQNALLDGGSAPPPPSAPPRNGRRHGSTDAVPDVRAEPRQISRAAISIVVE